MKSRVLRWVLPILLLCLVGTAWGVLGVEEKPRGIATPYWYNYSAGVPASYYLAAPTLAANDTAAGIAATQTLTNKTLTSPVISNLTASKPIFTDANKVPTSSGTLGADQGGTGLASYTIGDIPYASAATTIAKLADVAVGQVLVSGGVGAAPAYSASPTTTTHSLSAPRPTVGTGTGVTVADAGSLRTQVYKVTVAKENFSTAGVNHDLVIATMPAKSIIHSVLANVSEAFVCGSVCTTATLAATLGIAAGGAEYLESFDLDAATGWFGDADAEVGSKLDVAANTNGGFPVPAGGAITMRGVSSTGNWGDGAGATYLSAGSVTFCILYSVLP